MSVYDLKYPGINLGSTEPETHASAEEKVFGFWVFLMSDLILFSLLFATYATMIRSTAGGPSGKDIFDIKSVAIETGVLLASSFTFGMASLAMKYRNDRGYLLFWLAVTLLLGVVFLAFEVRDFLTMVAHGAVASRSGFLSAFFALVPTHGLHVTAGCVWIVVMMVQVLVFGIERNVKMRILRLGLFWHFLDIVWIGIFSVVYLQGLA
jgi:cytochrome o ubiquinol oxidase subunit III